MIVDRTVLNCKWGKGDEVVEAFKAVFAMPQPEGSTGGRILTDLSGEFFRVVLETQFENLAAWERWRATMFTSPEFGELFGRTADLIVSGTQEFYTVEATVG